MGAMGLYAEIVAMEEHDITINWKPIDGLVIVSDKAADYDAVADIQQIDKVQYLRTSVFKHALRVD